MKLLDKSKIDAAKQKERKTEIDEGVKLTVAIGDLRRLKAQEETNLAQYREGALKKIQSEIDVYLLERDGYAKEIITLQDARQSLLEPLTVEWKELDQAEGTLEKRKMQFIQDKNDFKKREKELDRRERTIAEIEKNLRERTLEIINKEAELQ